MFCSESAPCKIEVLTTGQEYGYGWDWIERSLLFRASLIHYSWSRFPLELFSLDRRDGCYVVFSVFLSGPGIRQERSGCLDHSRQSPTVDWFFHFRWRNPSWTNTRRVNHPLAILLLANWYISVPMRGKCVMGKENSGGKLWHVWLKERILFRRSIFSHLIWVGTKRVVSVLLRKCMI